LIVIFNDGTGGDADGRDVIPGSSFVGCPNRLKQQLNHVNKYPGVWGRAPLTLINTTKNSNYFYLSIDIQKELYILVIEG